MTTPPELKFPSHCPCCGSLTAVSAVPHCLDSKCGWLKCTCRANITQDGRHSNTAHAQVQCKTLPTPKERQ